MKNNLKKILICIGMALVIGLSGFGLNLAMQGTILNAAVYTNQDSMTARGDQGAILIGDLGEYNVEKIYQKGEIVRSNDGMYECQIADCKGKSLEDPSSWRKTSVFSQLMSMTGSLNQITNVVNNVNSTVGGGCYYTCYSTKSYLNGYKLRLTDGVSAKSCMIHYDEDSDYYAGALTAPLKNQITVELWYNNKLQGKLETGCDTSSGYSTINLDSLIDANFEALLAVNDDLSKRMCQDSHFTNNSALFPSILDLVYRNHTGLDQLMNTIEGLELKETTFEELYANTDDLLRVINSTIGAMFLQNSRITDDLAASRRILQDISADSDAVAKLENSSVMCNSLKDCALTQRQTMTAGEKQELSGNLILIGVESGSCGNRYSYGTRYTTGNHGTATMTDCVGYISQRPDCYYTRNGSQVKCIGAATVTGYGATYNYDGMSNHVSNNESTTAADMVVYPYKFCESVTVAPMIPATVTNCSGYWDNSDTRTASYPTAVSVITYIDLGAEDVTE